MFRAESRSIAPAFVAAIGIALAAPGTGDAITSGAVEVGVAGGLVAVEGTTRSEFAVRTGTFRAFGPGLAGLEAEIAHVHERDLDRLDALGALTWGGRLGESAAFPFGGVAAGVRQEWMGSFRTARYPVGITCGVRMMASERAALRVDVRGLRITGDPVADFTETSIVVGLSIFFRSGS